MKKIILLISFVLISVSAAFAATGQLNAYAYGASFVYAPEKQTIAVNYSLQADAYALRVVLIDGNGSKYVLKQFADSDEKTNPGAHNLEMSIWDAVDADKLPTNENLSVAIEVKTENRAGHESIESQNYTMQSAFSIDIDNNPTSKFFGLRYVTQLDAKSSLKRGVYIFDQWGTLTRSAQIDKDIKLYDSWYDETHGVPHMVRAIPDGSGRLLITHADKSQDTYLWLAKPDYSAGNITMPEYPNWTPVISNAQLVEWIGLSGAQFANVGIDIRENGENWDILLYTANAKTSVDFWADKSYSGVYSVPKSNENLTGGTYTAYTTDSEGIINQSYTQSMFNASANFDKFGGVLYNAHTDNANFDHTGPALKHRTVNGQFKQDYADGNLLTRTYVATKGVRFSPDFKKLAIAQNASKTSGKELRIYDVTQTDGNSHLLLSNGVDVDVISSSSVKAFVHDIAWDYAKNVYITVRNQTNTIHGVHAVATDLNDEAISTPVTTPDGDTYFTIGCSGDNYTISLNVEGGTGTLTGAGTYPSCTFVTVTAKPDNQYKFVRWTEGGEEVSTNPTYSFYATKYRILTAVFKPAVYNNITWWNLFENGQDIEDPNAKVNERLWRLLQVEYNVWIKNWKTRADQGTFADGKFKVTGFFYQSSTNGSNYYLSNFMNNENSPFKWLGDYLADVLKGTTFSRTTTAHLQGQIHAFINRSTPANNSGDYADSYGPKYDFSTKGQISSWRPYWTEKVCELPSTMTYNDAMPTEWNTTSTCSDGSIAGITPKNWYKWNHVDSKQNEGHSDTHIRAWRKDGVKGPIITRVEGDNWKLYATYVKKHIQEDDPTPDMSEDYPQDATNSDVFRLLFNKTWESDGFAHKLTITRKIQGGMYNTICFPFKVFLGDNGSMPGDNEFKQAIFWKYIGTDSKYNESGEPVTILEFQPETEVLEAGVPYLVLSDNDITREEILFGAKEDSKRLGYTHVFCDSVPKTVSAQKGDIPITFVGTINPTEVPAGSLILVADNRLAQTTEAGRMMGMRGYFTIDPMWASEIAEQAADGRVYLSMKKPTTTSIPVAPEAEQQRKPEVRKIMRDGQIYILRDNEVYTITGNRVK